jgi:alkanesulfonate monooxygenase SsuD/methylene tetrahydromethanopterin reductase-like flavin-dependent oxidoreductase (luciferase family)
VPLPAQRRPAPRRPTGTLHLATLIDAREPAAAERCTEAARLAERGGLDFVVLESGVDEVADALAVPAEVAAATDRIGVLPLLAPGPRDPAPALATLDWIGHGRGGWAVAGPAGTAGREPAPGRAPARLPTADAAAEPVADVAAEPVADVAAAVAGVAAAWDACTVVGGARAPQGRPVIAVHAAAWSGAGRRVAAHHADVVFVRAAGARQAAQERAALRDLAAGAGRDPDRLLVLADLAIDLCGGELGREPGAEAGPVGDGGAGFVFRGGPVDLAELVMRWRESGAVDGFLVRPLDPRRDLERFVNGTVALLQHRGRFRTFHPGATLREHLGLHRPARSRTPAPDAAPAQDPSTGTDTPGVIALAGGTAAP